MVTKDREQGVGNGATSRALRRVNFALAPRFPYNKVMMSFPMRRNTVVLIAVIFLLAVFAWAGWANWEYRRQAAERAAAASGQGGLAPSSDGIPQYNSPLEGRPAPAFTLDNLSGQRVSLESYRGKAVMVNFWATWCGPCVIETPWLVELRNKYAAQGFEILGIDTEADDAKPSDKAIWAKDQAAAAKFAAQMKISYPVLLGGDSLSQRYGGLDDLPASFFVDRKGTVIAASVGLTSESDIENNIKKAMGD